MTERLNMELCGSFVVHRFGVLSFLLPLPPSAFPLYAKCMSARRPQKRKKRPPPA